MGDIFHGGVEPRGSLGRVVVGSPGFLFRLITSNEEIRADEDPNHQHDQTNVVTGQMWDEGKWIRQICQEREAEEQKRDARNAMTCCRELHKDSIK